ncbi:MAG: hypothetical protein ACOYBY_13625 [Dermatophilaceae bacterium]
MTHTYTLRLLSMIALAAAGLISVLALSAGTMGAGVALVAVALGVGGLTLLMAQRARYTGRHRA